MAVAPSQHLLNTIESQPALVERLLADKHPVADAAARLRGARRVYLVGTGTSYHGAQIGEHLFRSAGIDALAMPAFRSGKRPCRCCRRRLRPESRRATDARTRSPTSI